MRLPSIQGASPDEVPLGGEQVHQQAGVEMVTLTFGANNRSKGLDGVLLRTVLFGLGTLLPFAPLFSLAHADDEIPDEPAKIELIADVTTFLPGKTFRLGVKFTMVEEWHVYWHSAREGGVGTTLKWKLPPGWTAGPIEWPMPRRYVLPGSLIAYGYDQEVLLQSEITVPADYSESSAMLAVAANWLVCKEICLIGEGSPQLQLSRASDSIKASKEAPLFQEWRARVPSSVGQLPISVRESLSKGEKRATWPVAVEWLDSRPTRRRKEHDRWTPNGVHFCVGGL